MVGWLVQLISFFVIILGNKSFIILCGFGQRQYLLFYTDMKHDFFILQIERTYISLLIYIFSFCTMDSMLYTIQFPLPPGKKFEWATMNRNFTIFWFIVLWLKFAKGKEEMRNQHTNGASRNKFRCMAGHNYEVV